MKNLSPKRLYSTARRIFCCKKPPRTLENVIDNVWELKILKEDNVEPFKAEKEYIEPFQIKGQFCRLYLAQPWPDRECSLWCADTNYLFQTGNIERAGPGLCNIEKSSKFPEDFSRIRLVLEILLRFSQQRRIARMNIVCFPNGEIQREYLRQRMAEFDKIPANFPKIRVKKLLLGDCDRNFGMERFFDYEYLHLYRGTQLYRELNTAKFLVIADKQENPEEIKNFTGWGLVVMEAEANDFSPGILKDQVTEWLETGNCQYKFLCIFDEKREIIEDSIIKWALSLEGEPIEKTFENSRANLKKRLVYGEEEGILYIFQKNCILFMRGDAICEEFNPLLEFGGPNTLIHMFFLHDQQEKIVPFTKEMFP